LRLFYATDAYTVAVEVNMGKSKDRAKREKKKPKKEKKPKGVIVPPTTPIKTDK
jgi:hypothetical protein